MIDVNLIVTGAVGLVSSSLSATISWLLARKKYNTEVDSNLIKNMQESLDFYKQLSDDNKARLDEYMKRNDCLEDEIKELRNQVFDVMNNICYNLMCQHRQRVKQDED